MRAAEAILARDGSVGPLELLQEMRLLEPVHVADWKRGREYARILESWIQGSPEKKERAFAFFLDWAASRGLQPIEAFHARTGPAGAEALQVTADGDGARERFFRTNYAEAGLSARRVARLQEKLSKPRDIVVFRLVSPSSKCSACGVELHKGQLLFMDKEQPRCLSCAGLDHLEFLASGDATLSRRARKYSALSAVVVRFSRTRRRYERQGILATPEAIARAEHECGEDRADITTT